MKPFHCRPARRSLIGILLLFAVAVGVVRAQQTVVWSDNFDDATPDDRWAPDGGAWALGTPTRNDSPPVNAFGFRAHSGAKCAGTVLASSAPSGLNTRLVRLQSFTVPAASLFPRLRFFHWFGTDYFGTSGATAKVQAKRVGTTNWVDVSPAYTFSSGGWSSPSIDLRSFAGAAIQIGFLFTSTNPTPGWFVDDVSLVTGTPVLNNPEGWEQGIPGDWYAETGLWDVVLPTLNNGPRAANTGKYCVAVTGELGRLSSRWVSPPFQVPAASAAPRLRFYHWFNLDYFGSRTTNGRVQVRAVGATTWTDVSPLYTGTSGGWSRPSVDLSNYAGTMVEVAFLFTQGGNATPGWYIDDVLIQTDAAGFSGSYFGTISGNNGTWSMIVRADGSGTYLAYINNPRSAVVAEVKVNADGTFRTTSTALLPLSGQGGGRPVAAAAAEFTLTGTISGTSVAGALEGLNLTYTGSADAAGGTTAGVSGFYKATTPTNTTTVYTIAGPSGRTMALTVGTTLVDGGLGTINSDGAFTVTTPNNTSITGAVTSATGAISATVTPAAGATQGVTVSGGAVDPTGPPTRLANLSILTNLVAARESFSLGFVIGGAGTSGAKPLVIRAAGPSLGALGVPGTLVDPRLELFSGSTSVAVNDNWGGAPALASAMVAVGAFPYVSPTSRDALLVTSLATRDNSVKISATDNGVGTVIAEVYDATAANGFTPTTPRLINVSVLKEIGGGFTVAFVVSGETTRTVLVRAVGPGLAEFGVGGAVADPRLTIFAGAAKSDENDNWTNTATMVAAAKQVGAFELKAGSKDAALLTTLSQGSYSVQVASAGGAAGSVLVEVYEIP